MKHVHPKSVDSDISDEDDVPEENITMEEGINQASYFIHLLEQWGFINQQDVLHVHRIQEKLMKEKPKFIKQMTLQ